MEELCKKLDYIKSVVTNLISSNCVDIETMYTKCLTKFPSEKQQLLKIREVKLEIETQLRQLIRKAEEVCATKQMCEELKLKLDEKELAILNERAQRFDAEGRQMVIVLDEVVRGFEGEIEGLKTLLPVLCNKCDDQVEINAKGFKELRDIDDDLLGMLEDENVKIKNELKREKGRFKQLEEAYGNVQDESCLNRMEWEHERLKLVGEIGSLQRDLSTQTRLFESVKGKLHRLFEGTKVHLQMCNRAHLRGESERKLLQVQVCESKACYENVLSEYQQVKCEIECYRYLTTSQVKEEEYVLMQKEMERYKMLLEESVVEQLILKEEALEIGNGLREELRNVSDVLEKATYELAEKTSEETECAVQLQNWKHIAESSKTTLVKEEEYVFMQKELERYKMMLKESDVEQLILKEEALEIENGLREELRNVSDALEKTTHELAEKTSEETECAVQLQNWKHIAESWKRSLVKEEEYGSMQKELERYKMMLEESDVEQLLLKEEALEIENGLREELRNVSDALERTNYELAEKTSEETECAVQLQNWKHIAESSKTSLVKNQRMRKEMEDCLFAQIEIEQSLKQENESLILISKEKHEKVVNLQQKFIHLKEKLARKDGLHYIVEEKYMNEIAKWFEEELNEGK